MKLGRIRLLGVDAGQTQHQACLPLDQGEMVMSPRAPAGLAALGLLTAAFGCGVHGPRHPGQELLSRRDDRLVQALGVCRGHRFEQEPLGLDRRCGCAQLRAGPTQTVWALVNSLMPISDSSRP